MARPNARRGRQREGQSGTRGERTELWVTRKAAVRWDQCSQDTAARLRVAAVVLQEGQQIPTTRGLPVRCANADSSSEGGSE